MILASLRGNVDPGAFSLSEGQPFERESTRFLGVEMDVLDLADRRFASDTTAPLDLRGSAIDAVDFDDTRFTLGCRLEGYDIGTLSATTATFAGPVSCRNAHVAGPVEMSGVASERGIEFRRTVVEDDVELDWAKAEGRIDLGFSQVEGSVVGFTLLFYVLGLGLEGFTSETYRGLFGALLLSLESFPSLVLGGTTVEPRSMRFVANLQGFVGAFLIALLAFTLTRSLHR